MKNIINYYYKLEPSELRMVGNNYYFKINYTTFLFFKFDISSLSELLNILNQTQKIPYIHTIIYNQNKEFVTFDGNNYYILFKVNINQNRYIELEDILNFYNDTKILIANSKNSFNWSELWTRKIDYLEYYITTKDNLSDKIKSIFNYFIGLGENAISYIRYILENTTPQETDKLSFVHKRIDYKFTLYDLYNPVTLVIDHVTRDISEYLKSLFLDKNYNYKMLDILFSKLNLSDFGYKILFARMIFPTFFFDIFDKYEYKDISEKSFLSIYDRAEEYQNFLLLIYDLIKKTKNINIPRIIWLNK